MSRALYFHFGYANKMMHEHFLLIIERELGWMCQFVWGFDI